MKAGVVHENAEIFVEGSARRYPSLPLKEDPVEVTEVPMPAPKKGQVLIEIEACGVCYTDIDIIKGQGKVQAPTHTWPPDRRQGSRSCRRRRARRGKGWRSMDRPHVWNL